ncbi:MAG: hypothetical protein DMG97_38500, partial [Acidobacteria bacterium]
IAHTYRVLQNIVTIKWLCHSDRSSVIRNANHAAKWRNLLSSARAEQQVSPLRKIVRFATNPAPVEMTMRVE